MIAPAPAGPEAAAGESPGECDVLLLLASRTEGQFCRRVLRDLQVESVVCRSIDQLLARLRAGCGPVVCAAERLDRDAVRRLLTCLDDQPEWSDPPLLLIVREGMVSGTIQSLIDKPKTTLLHRPIKFADFTTAIRTAIENRRRQYMTRRLIRQMREQAWQLQRLWLELIETEERERQRLAELLHDDLQQILVAVNYRLGMLADQASGGGLERITKGLSTMLNQAIEKSRQLSRELYPPVLQQQHGIGDALLWLSEQMTGMHGLRIALDLDIPDDDRISVQQKVFLFRCAQEFLFNVIKHAKTKEATLRLARRDGHLELSVADDGCGFSPDRDESEDGTTGLGLVGIRERARALGGRLQVQSVPGRGTTIVLNVPEQVRNVEAEPRAVPDAPAAAVESAPAVSRLATPDPAPSASATRVLLADDHKVMRSGLRALLDERRNVDVIAEAGDGTEAVELARRLRPDVIVMDVAMPRMNGLDATRRIKADHPDIRIIGLTMFDDKETHEKMIEAGAERCLTKTAPGHAVVDVVLHSSPPARRSSAPASASGPKSARGPHGPGQRDRTAGHRSGRRKIGGAGRGGLSKPKRAPGTRS